MLVLVSAAAAIWLAIVILPLRPWSTAETLDSAEGTATHDLSGVTAIVPARNESPYIAATLRQLTAQGGGIQIIVVDDQSNDGTAEIVRGLDIPGLMLLHGSQPPSGWSGKLWALQQGFQELRTEQVLLIDADVVLRTGIVKALTDKLQTENLGLVSLMVQLRMQRFWERALIPAFVYFFKFVYPFRLANSTVKWFAAAAGGCILTRRALLAELGGFGAFKDALIDDCTLAQQIKARGHGTWIGLTHSAWSMRSYEFSTIWNMVARTAFTQLRYSLLLLVLCSCLMVTAYWGPLLAVFSVDPRTQMLGAAAAAAMAFTYMPTLRYYDRALLWVLALPVIASLYLAMTWSSAIRYWGGERSHWKGRSYQR